MGITNKGGYPTMFLVSKSMQFYKAGHWVVFIKLGQKHASKGGVELAIIKPLREVLIEALSLGFGVAELVIVGTFLIHSVSYDTNKQTHDQAKELKAFIVELESEII
jgi:hypothetical protein